MAWSRGRTAWNPPGPESENIQVHGSHCGLGGEPGGALYAIADRLAQPLDDWHPFAAKGLMGLMYPSGNA